MSGSVADFLAASVTGDPGMGRGFFLEHDGKRTDAPLANLDLYRHRVDGPYDVGETTRTGKNHRGGAVGSAEELIAGAPARPPASTSRNTLRSAAAALGVDIPSSLSRSSRPTTTTAISQRQRPHECAIRVRVTTDRHERACARPAAPSTAPGQPRRRTRCRRRDRPTSRAVDDLPARASTWREAQLASPEPRHPGSGHGGCDPRRPRAGFFAQAFPLSPQLPVSFSMRANLIPDGGALIPRRQLRLFRRSLTASSTRGHPRRLLGTDFEAVRSVRERWDARREEPEDRVADMPSAVGVGHGRPPAHQKKKPIRSVRPAPMSSRSDRQD